MPITLAVNGSIRNEVLGFLAHKKASEPHYSVVDVGGTANPWADAFVDTYIDLQTFQTAKEIIQGDICSADFWDSVPAKHYDTHTEDFYKIGVVPKFWDFSICTHVLEDVRNPDMVLANLMRISDAGFIAMPNKQTELSPIESLNWVGYAHHRWVYTVADNELRILAKTCIANVFIPMRHLLTWLDDSQVSKPGGAPELGFMWAGDFLYTFIGHDLTDAHSPQEVANLYINGLAEGL